VELCFTDKETVGFTVIIARSRLVTDDAIISFQERVISALLTNSVTRQPCPFILWSSLSVRGFKLIGN